MRLYYASYNYATESSFRFDAEVTEKEEKKIMSGRVFAK